MTLPHPRPKRAPPAPIRYWRGTFHHYYDWRRRRFVSTETLSWVLPTVRTDGSAIGSDTLTVTISATVNGSGPIVVDTLPGQAPGSSGSFTTAQLDPNSTYVWTATVTDTEGDVSAATNSVTQTVPPVKLAPPATFTLTGIFNP